MTMDATCSVTDVEELVLRENEQHEADAFNRIADRTDPARLRTSDWTFARYRRAVLGRPFFWAYPDLAFVRLGRCLGRGGDRNRPLKGLTVLDMGAGDGIWSVILAEQGARVTSVEISPNQVELARARMRIHGLQWEARVGSAYCLEEQFPAESFDLIFSQAILHHLTHDLPRVYHGMHALLRPGGHAIITEPYCGSPALRRLRERLSWLLPIDCESPDERPLTDADLAPLTGLFEITADRFELFSRVVRRLWRRGGLENAVHRLDRALLRRRALGRLAGGIFITARKPRRTGRGPMTSDKGATRLCAGSPVI